VNRGGLDENQQNAAQWRDSVYTMVKLGFCKRRTLLDQLNNYELMERDPVQWVTLLNTRILLHTWP
jgi:hypothetical protein